MNKMKANSLVLKQQRGVALVISLILLTVITMLSLTAMRSANLDTKIAVNHQHKQYAFQAAENALTSLTSNPLEDLENGIPALLLPGTISAAPVENSYWYHQYASTGNPELSADLTMDLIAIRKGLKISGYGLNTKSPVYQADAFGRVDGTSATTHNRMEVALIRY